MSEVARAADVAEGTVFQYAATKVELLMMVVADEYADTIPAVLHSRTGRQAPAARVRQLLEPLATRALQDPDTSAAIARELLFGTEGPHRGEVIELVAERGPAPADFDALFAALAADAPGDLDRVARVLSRG